MSTVEINLSATHLREASSRVGSWLVTAVAWAPMAWIVSACNPAIVGDDSGTAGQAGASSIDATFGGANGTNGGAESTGGEAGNTSLADVGGAAGTAPRSMSGGAASVAGAPGAGGASTNGGALSVGGSNANSTPKTTCGGLLGTGCGTGQYCSYAANAQCGAADQTGICTPMPVACTEQYQPVCGCDGKTYGNACSAASTGVSVAANGECAAQPPTGMSCGGLTGKACSKGMFCSYAPDAKCGAADQTGICNPMPAACTEQYQPVCGCDGKTYGNACAAASTGVSVAADGECAAPQPRTGTSCGGLAGGGCAKDQFCNYPAAAACGAFDMNGTCANVPQACDMVYAPVCGCDGKTYSNSCLAAAAAMSIQASGACTTN